MWLHHAAKCSRQYQLLVGRVDLKSIVSRSLEETMPLDDMFPRFVDHTYREFSNYIEKGGKIEKHKKSESNFPARLHEILSDEQYSHLISWMPHGRAWKVINKELLTEEVIPKFFGQSKYASFNRQLSGWGFKRLQRVGPDFGCYYHECFLRGKPELTRLMRRVPRGQGKATPNMHAEPDFYSIAKIYPLEKSANIVHEASKYADKVVHAAKQAAPNMESFSNHHWDPAAAFQYDPMSSSQPISFAGGGTKEGFDMKYDYDPYPVSHHFQARAPAEYYYHREASYSFDEHQYCYHPYNNCYDSGQGVQGASANQPHYSSQRDSQYQYSPISLPYFTQMNSSNEDDEDTVPNPKLDA